MWTKLTRLFHKTWFNIIIVFSLTGFVFWYTMKDNFDQIVEVFRHINVPWVFLILILVIAERGILGWGLMTEVRLTHPEYKWSQGFVNAYVAGFFNNVTPSASGGQFFQALIFRKQNIPVSHSVGILWMDFIIYQSTMSAYVLILLLLKFSYYFYNASAFFLIVIFGFMVSAGIIVFLWLLAHSKRFYTWLTTKGIGVLHRINIIKDKEKAIGTLYNELDIFSREVEILKKHRRMIIAVSLSVVVRLTIYWSVPFLCAKALNVHIGWDKWLDMLALAAFVAMVNAFLPMPGSSGGTEATFVLMYSTIMTSVDATSTMVLWRVLTFYVTLVIGGAVYAYANSRRPISFTDRQVLEGNKVALKKLPDEFKKQADKETS